MFLTAAQEAVGFVELKLIQITFRMVLETGNQLDLVRQLDDIIVRSRRESLALHHWIVIARQNNYGNVFRLSVAPIPTNQVQPIDARHNEILQNNGGADALSDCDSLRGIGAVVKRDLALLRQSPANRLANYGLVVYQ